MEGLRKALDRQLVTESWDRPGVAPGGWFILSLILLSAVVFTLWSDPDLSPAWDNFYKILNFGILCTFAAEFLLRLWCAGTSRGISGFRARCRHVGFFWLTVDLLAFLPELLAILLYLVGVIDIDAGWVKLVRLLRFLKLGHMFPAIETVRRVLASVWQELLVSILLAMSLVYGAAVALYLIESSVQPEVFGSIGHALWWSIITLTTVGYGDVVPITTPGKAVAAMIALLGIGLIALPSGIIAGAFIDDLRHRREERAAAREASKPEQD